MSKSMERIELSEVVHKLCVYTQFAEYVTHGSALIVYYSHLSFDHVNPTSPITSD